MQKNIIVLALVFVLFIAAPLSAGFHYPEGVVFAMTNDADNNQVVMYNRADDGSLTYVGAFNTGGQGLTLEPGDALGSQNPLILSPRHRRLFAVNAGSNTVSVFQVSRSGLSLVDVVDSGGDLPVSLTMYWNILYVLNAGGDGNITGHRIGFGGHLTPLAGSTRSLNADGTNPPFFLESPAQVGFSPLGNKLVVAVKGKHPVHQIHVFKVNRHGLPSAQPITTTSNTTISFGFVFLGLNKLIVAEPFGNSLGPGVPPPVPATGAASSYRIRRDGNLVPISVSVLNAQTATCWMAITPNGRYGYTTNNLSDTISSYKVGRLSGSLALIEADAASTGAAPVDLAITPNSRYLYNVNAFAGTVGMYEINRRNGSLVPMGEIDGLPADGSAVGIAVH